MLKKIAAWLFNACFIFTLVAFIGMLALALSLGQRILEDDAKNIPFDQIEAVTYFLRASGVILAALTLVRWVTKWPWPVSWFSLALAASALAFAAVGHRFQITLAGDEEVLPWRYIIYAFGAMSVFCSFKWVIDPSSQKRQPKRG